MPECQDTGQTVLAFRHLKRETRWRLLENDPDLISSLPAPEPLPETLEPGLLAVIDQLSPASRAALLLHYQQDLPIEETAMVLDIPVGTAKSRLAYGLSVPPTAAGFGVAPAR